MMQYRCKLVQQMAMQRYDANECRIYLNTKWNGHLQNIIKFSFRARELGWMTGDGELII
uniref:Uncharacterized protein n=1 Tax=Arundo donax TaxID=35708 RepID=A0A0A9HEK5_ARUDO